jgi:hypothetical protein
VAGLGLQLTLLTRAYCHLCDDMLAALRPLAAARGAIVAVVDVDADPALERAFGERVPVLFAGDPAEGVEHCHYPPDPARVEQALSGPGKRPIEVAPGAKFR